MATTGPTQNMTAAQFLAHELRQLIGTPEHMTLQAAVKVASSFTAIGDLRKAFDETRGSKFQVLQVLIDRLNVREDDINNLKTPAYPTLNIGLEAIAREYETRLISERRSEVQALWNEASRAFQPFHLEDRMSSSEGVAAELDFTTRHSPK